MRIRFGKLITSFLLSFGLLTVAGTVFAQHEVSVEIGKTKSFTHRRQVYPDSVRVQVHHPSIARGRLDTNRNVFTIEGLNVGTTSLTFRGTYRAIIVGGRIEEQAQPFTERFVVRVLPRVEEIDRQTRRIEVSAGYKKTYQASIYLGSEFRNLSEEGIKWRNLRVPDRGNSSIATIETNKPRMNFTINGIATGRTTITIQGEKMVDRVWKTIIRDLEVVVGTGADADAELRRRLKRLQDAAQTDLDGETTGLPEERLRDLIQQFEQFIASIERLVADERRLPNPNEERLRRLNSIIDDANKDLRRLRGELAGMSNTVRQIDWNDTAATYRGRNNQRFTFRCGGSRSSATVWGTDTYTDDSSICRAAVHVGVITTQSGGVVTIEIRPGLQSYTGSSRNGIASNNWKSWGGSFVFVR